MVGSPRKILSTLTRCALMETGQDKVGMVRGDRGASFWGGRVCKPTIQSAHLRVDRWYEVIEPADLSERPGTRRSAAFSGR